MTIHAAPPDPPDTIDTFTANDTTPSVADSNYFRTANTAPTTITTFHDGTTAQSITVIIDDAFTTIDFTGGNLLRPGGTDYIAVQGDILTGLYDGTDWYCAITPRPRIVWDDMKFPFTRDKQGQAAKPDFDFAEHGLLFPQNDDTEIVHIIDQMKHQWLLESNIRPHIHYVQDEADIPVFKLDYRWYRNGDDPTIAYTTIAQSGMVFPYTAGSILQIAEFPEISGAGIDTLSSFIDFKFYRDDNVVAGDILVKEFDIHIQIDSNGSRDEYVKW